MEDLLAGINWQLLIAAVLAIFTVVSYVLTRRRELAWRRTEFLCKEAEYLENDPVLIEMVTILEGRHAELTATAIFGTGNEIDTIKRNEYQQKFDKLLGMLWRHCYAYLETKTISRKELEGFGWYLWKVSQNPALVKYCETQGFDEIIAAIGKLRVSWDEAEIDESAIISTRFTAKSGTE
jgi:hypothetical protein